MGFSLIFFLSYYLFYFFFCPLPWWQCPSLALTSLFPFCDPAVIPCLFSSIPKPQLWKLLAHKYLDFLVFYCNYIPHYLLRQTQKLNNFFFFFNVCFSPCCSFWQSRADLKRINQTRPVLEYFYVLVHFLRRWKMWTQTFGEKGIWILITCCSDNRDSHFSASWLSLFCPFLSSAFATNPLSKAQF